MIRAVTGRTVYYSPRQRRHYLTAKAAANAEASARMKRWFPTEAGEHDQGYCIDPGFHFTEVPRLVAIRDRLAQRYLRQLRGAA